MCFDHPMIPAATRMGAVHLTVSDLARSLEYYEGAIGLRVLSRDDGRASLGGDEELLVLVEQPGAPSARGHTGLFHVALLVPSRGDLANWLAHSVRDRVPLTGASDHAVSEALYLRDPDEHGLEIYADRPRELWEGRVFELMTTEPLDANGLLAEADEDGFTGLPDGTRVGHVHLCVSEIPETIAFYRDTAGFDLVAALGPEAAFLSAGGYHHHIGANTWESRGRGRAPEGSASLRHATVVLPSRDERDALADRLGAVESEHGPLAHDPSGNALVLAHA
jgi:catechol 2,3-dioxygenase